MGSVTYYFTPVWVQDRIGVSLYLYICLLAHLNCHMFKRHQIFRVTYLWLCFRPLLTTRVMFYVRPVLWMTGIQHMSK